MGWSLPPQARGVWVKIPAVEVIEVLAASGLDFVVIDREHGAVDLRAMTAMIAVARGLVIRVFVRVPNNTPEEVQPALDAGAHGLFVPHVDDGDAAARIVEFCRFPPLGSRHGSSTTRFGEWGALDLAEFVRRGNEEVMLVAQIETPRAVENIHDILGVAGIDAVFLGPFDLALSSGLPSGAPEFLSMVRRVEKAVAERPVGGVAGDAAGARELVAKGYSFVLAGADTSLLGGAARTLTEQGTS